MKMYRGVARGRACGCSIFDDEIGLCNIHHAAPELLEMLKAVRKDGAGIHYEEISKLIAKAEGKE